MFQEEITFQEIIQWLRRVANTLEEKKRYLDRLDSPIGDGDHGRTIANAFNKIIPILDSSTEEDVGGLLVEIGKSLAFSTGAATGPLYGTAFMEAGKLVKGKKKIYLDDCVRMIQAAEEGVKRRGKAEVGDKTMLDTIHPVRESLEHSLSESDSLKVALEKAKKSARKGMESTKEIISRKGRASRLGERSRGHIDPGAASTCLIIEAW